MQFLLQQGWGMLGLDSEFIRAGFASGVILSPRVYTPEQLERHSNEMRGLGATLLFDPQFYEPRTEREKLLSYPYWDGLNFDTATFDGSRVFQFCENVIEYQVNTLNVSHGVIPGRYTNSITEEWLEMQHDFAETAASLNLDIPLYASIALGPDVISNQEALYNLLDEITGYPVDGLYFVFRPSQDRFFVRDDGFLYNLLDAFLSLRLQKKDIILGYANQQSIIFAAAGVAKIASGNFRNTRHFNPEIFDEQDESVMQRGIWYYHPRSLSEFRVDSLRLAFRRGLRDLFGPTCDYCRELLDAQDPGSVRWGEREAFRHFLYELNQQWLGLDAANHSELIDRLRNVLSDATTSMNELRSRAFVLGERAFAECLDCTIGALEAFVEDRKDDIERIEAPEDTQ